MRTGEPTPQDPGRPSFAGQVAIVTGAATGIGEAAARSFASLGAAVLLADLSADAGAVAAELTGLGAKAAAVRTDVTKGVEVEAMTSACLERFGRIDVLVNGAGGFRRRIPSWEMDEAEWDLIMNINLKSVYLCSKAVLPGMIERGGGRIVNVASGAGRTATHITAGAYSAAKGGVLAFTRHLALEVARHGITVNAVAPGVTLTPRIDALYDDGRKQALRSLVPLGRLAEAQDQAGPIVFLASEAASYITGATLDVNGGRYMI
ncbi:MAG: SDR family NAD(P)-dependent oxidoreductase [Candidatus Dormibacteraceae bacterium]